MVFHIYWHQEGVSKEYGKIFEGFPQMVEMLRVCRELQRLGKEGKTRWCTSVRNSPLNALRARCDEKMADSSPTPVLIIKSFFLFRKVRASGYRTT